MGRKFPDDANYTCAYVLLNIPDLNLDDLVEIFKKVKSQDPIDEKYHVEYLEFMIRFAIMNIRQENFGEFMDKVKESDKTPSKSYSGHNFAEEFKLALEKGDAGEVASIFNDWTESKDFDSNYYYAKALIYSGTEGKTLDDAFKEYEEAKELNANDESLEPWFKSVSWKFIKMKTNQEGKLVTLNI